MAVQIDISAFRSSIPAQIAAAAEVLLRDGSVDALAAVGGGAEAVVSDGGTRFQPWVGVVDRAFTGDCDCADESADDGFCAHAVAVALAAVEAGVKFSAAGNANGTAPVGRERAGYLQAVQRLGPRQLTNLVVEQALRDRLFATMLLGGAGLLNSADESSALDDFETAIQEAAEATTGHRWEIADVEIAGQRLLAEAEILCAHPAVPAMLDLIEQAIQLWDDLAGHLNDAYDVRRIDPDEISEPLVDAHRDLCERLGLDSDEVSERLDSLISCCRNNTVNAAVYADLLGDA